MTGLRRLFFAGLAAALRALARRRFRQAERLQALADACEERAR